MSHGELLPPPQSYESVRDVIAGMPSAFDSAAAGDLDATIQFDITDEEPGDYYVTIENGVCKAYAGAHPDPTATIHTPADVWLQIVRGELKAATAFMGRQFTTSGDMGLLMRMTALFGAPRAET
jgi:putative sterol carrier protein